MSKKINLYPLSLNLFEGDGAGTGAGPTGNVGDGSASGEETNNSYATGKKGKSKGALSNVVYGVQDTPPADNLDTEINQAAADVKPSTITTSDTLEAKKAEFESLIKGEYKDLFGERMQEIINKRFKESKTLETQVEAIKPIIEMLGSKYGVTDGDIEKLSKAIQEDDSYYEEEAIEKGLTVEQLKQIKTMERENAELKKAQENMAVQKQAEETYSKWISESEQVKQLYPGFDLNAEAQNPDFVKLLKAGVSVQAAYQSVHMDNILGGAMQATAQKVQQATVNNIRSRSQRPAENGLSSQTGVIVKPSARNLTPEDRKEIVRRAARGETIKFN